MKNCYGNSHQGTPVQGTKVHQGPAMKIKILATDEHGQTRTKHDIFIVSGRGSAAAQQALMKNCYENSHQGPKAPRSSKNFYQSFSLLFFLLCLCLSVFVRGVSFFEKTLS
ncbi:MAG: hypothetical protein MUF15_09315 [Acidobacteria bacterium]|jgi:hypothetical protein|nr:hypothetical protein [Acidobacteriota bacterium]